MNKNIKKLIMSSINVISMSGGKDSTAQLLLAISWGVKSIHCVFADTGHEHEDTYEYLDYLRKSLDIDIHVVKADFSREVIKKRDLVRGKWVDDGAITADQAEEICRLLTPTGIPFLDLCMWKGRFPSTRARFCSQELKHNPLDLWMLEKSKHGRVISWQGVRADESRNRRDLPKWARGEYGSLIFRPILNWDYKKVFAQHDRAGILPNPLYKKGMGRVGCMPCIHANKSELKSIALRCPEEVERVANWEAIVSKVSKRGCSTFFHAATDPMIATSNNNDISIYTHGIKNIIEWAKTERGGRQYALLDVNESPSMCSSAYGLCE